MQNPFGNGDNENNNSIPLPPNYATVVNKTTGQIRIAKVGFSWTSFIFNFWPAIFRSDWYNFLCMMGVQLILAMMISMAISEPFQIAFSFAAYVLSFVWGFLYNMMYFKHLFKIGFEPVDKHSKELLIKSKYLRQ